MKESVVNIIAVILIILVILIIFPTKCNIINEGFIENLKIPPIIIQFYPDKDNFPKSIKNNINSFAYGYQHLIFDSKECQYFLQTNFDQIVIQKYNSLKNNDMKLELFKYCYLYKHGGIFISTKCQILRPINSLIKNNYIYTILSKNNTSIHTDLLASQPNRSLYIQLINYILYAQDLCQLMTFKSYFYNLLSQKINKYPLVGLNKINEFNFVYLFKEECTIKQNKYDNKCLGEFDKSNLCCFINDFNQTIIRSNA